MPPSSFDEKKFSFYFMSGIIHFLLALELHLTFTQQEKSFPLEIHIKGNLTG